MSQQAEQIALNDTTEPRGPQRLLIAFRHQGYPLLWTNTIFTSVGFWLEIIAQGWLVLQLTDSAFWVGAVAGARGLGILSLGIFGGTIADQVDRRKLIIFVQAIGMVLAITMGVLTATGLVQLWHILALSWVQGASLALIMPSRNALTYDLVGREVLLNAMAANYWGMNITRVVGPSAAGVIVATMGVSGCYFLMGASNAVGIAAISLVPTIKKGPGGSGTFWQNLKAGIAYVLGHNTIRVLLASELLMDAFAFSHMFMLPVFARDVLKVGPLGLGLLMSASGIGAMISAATVASLGDFHYKGRLLLGAMFAFGASLALFSASPWFGLSLAFIFVVGMSSAAYDTTMSTLLQSIVPDEMRGRVMGLYVLTWSMTPLGSFQAGAVASLLGVPFAVGLGGAVIAAYALGLARGTRTVRAL